MKSMGRDYADRMHSQRQADEIQAMATEIAGHIPNMWRRSPHAVDFWRWFCGELDSVHRNAPSKLQQERLRSALMRALEKSGIPEPPKSLRVKC